MKKVDSFCNAISEEDRKHVWQFAKIATADSYVADDIYQNVMIQAWRDWDNLDTGKPLTGYLHIITKHKIAEHYRKKRPILTINIDKYDENSGNDTLEMIMERENKRELIEAINTLPLDFEQVILLHYYKGMSLREIADMLNLKYGAVCYRHKTGLKILRKKLDVTIGGGQDSPGRRSKMTFKTFILMFGVWEYA